MRNEKEWTIRRRVFTRLVEGFLRLYQSECFQVALKAIPEHTCVDDFFVPVETIASFDSLLLPCLEAVKRSQAARVDGGKTRFSTYAVRNIDIYYFIKIFRMLEDLLRAKDVFIFQLYSSLEVKYHSKYYSDGEEFDAYATLKTPVSSKGEETVEYEYQILTNDSELGLVLRDLKLNRNQVISTDHQQGYVFLYKDVLGRNNINEGRVWINFVVDALACYSITFGGLGGISYCKQCDHLCVSRRQGKTYCSDKCRKKFYDERKLDELRCFKRNKIWYIYAHQEVSRVATNVQLKPLNYDICNECKQVMPLPKGGNCPFWLKENMKLRLTYLNKGRKRIKTNHE